MIKQRGDLMTGIVRQLPQHLRGIGLHLILSLGVAVMALPFIWMLSTSLKIPEQTLAYPPIWIPDPIRWDNYLDIWEMMPFGQFLLNSLKISSIIAIGQMITGSMAGYAFAKIRFPGRNAMFATYLMTLMIPYVVTMIPLFMIMRQLGWINNHASVIVPLLTNALATFLMRQFFLAIPDELIDAARIDGANPFQIYLRVMLPLAKPALATVGIFSFIASWNDFLWPLLMLQRQELKTITVGLSYFRSMYQVQWHYLMAASVTALLPTLILFIFLQRYYARGFVTTGIRG
ncbi:MAG: ABC transporter permease subunit [Anaerolineales bacterium]|nr:ABC transporter permease subunit [Anaerolineales bacterium]